MLEVAKNGPGEIQDVNYRGGRGNNNCDFDFKISNENYLKDRLRKSNDDRLSSKHNNGAAENPVGNLAAMED